MHIPDGFISGPINAAGAALAVAACAGAVFMTRRRLGERQVPLLGMTAAFIFAAHMFQFPVAGGTSGHVLGAAFATMLLGPWAACLVLTMVVMAQCLLFADGGITALGTNIINIAVIGVGVSAVVLAGLRTVLPRGRSSLMAAAGLAAWASVVAASAACAIELGLSGKPMELVLPAMLAVHSVIGLGEAAVTVGMASMILTARPDLMPGADLLIAPRVAP